MSEWINIGERLPDDSEEIEIAFWDGVCMCRAFGAYIEYEGWFSCDWRIEDDFTVTHWKFATKLPESPEDL